MLPFFCTFMSGDTKQSLETSVSGYSVMYRRLYRLRTALLVDFPIRDFVAVTAVPSGEHTYAPHEFVAHVVLRHRARHFAVIQRLADERFILRRGVVGRIYGYIFAPRAQIQFRREQKTAMELLGQLAVTLVRILGKDYDGYVLVEALHRII